MVSIRVTVPGLRLDQLVFEHYGFVHGAVEAVLAANRDLAALGVHVPVGTWVRMPDLHQPEQTQVALWP